MGGGAVTARLGRAAGSGAGAAASCADVPTRAGAGAAAAEGATAAEGWGVCRLGLVSGTELAPLLGSVAVRSRERGSPRRRFGSGRWAAVRSRSQWLRQGLRSLGWREVPAGFGPLRIARSRCWRSCTGGGSAVITGSRRGGRAAGCGRVAGGAGLPKSTAPRVQPPAPAST